MLSFAELAVCRARYVAAAGCPPPEELTPTAEQLAALQALLSSGRVPYVDFSVWCPFGSRLARFRKTDAQVFVGNTLVTKRVDGPANFECWLSSWDLFSVALVSLGAARLGTCMRYRAGMTQLMKLFPRHWGVLQTTDIVLRSERWGRIREHLESYLTMGVSPPGFDANAPWDLVISVSAFGAEGINASWWQSSFLLPCTVTSAPGAASNMIRAVEGQPDSGASSSSLALLPPPQSAKGGGRGDKGDKEKPRRDRNKDKSTASSTVEICKNWNASIGACAGDGPCTHGRKHICDVCGGNHRRIEKHGKRQQNQGKGNDRKKQRND